MKFIRLNRRSIALFTILISALCLLAFAFDQKATTERLGGEERFTAHLSTDKPIYRPDENVYLRAVLRNAFDNSLSSGDGWAEVKIISPGGAIYDQGGAGIMKGVMGFSWRIPPQTPGGEYIMRVECPSLGISMVERAIEIRAFRQRRMRTSIEFDREGYGPSDAVSASLKVTRSEGGIPENAAVTMTARVDGVEIWSQTATISSRGTAFAAFSLPETIVEGQGVLTFTIEDGGVVETATKTIPIVLNTISLSVYPEGGDAVAGLKNRYYFEAKRQGGLPADVTLELVNSRDERILSVSTEHEGRGSFEHTPISGESYRLRVTEPWNIHTETPLPESEGLVVLRPVAGSFGPNEPVAVDVACTAPLSLRITLSRVEKVLDEQVVNLDLSSPDEPWKRVFLSAPAGLAGVLRVTVWMAGDQPLPLAERLVFREPSDDLRVHIEPSTTNAVTGSQMSVRIKTTDGKGNPIPAFVGLTVTDDAVLEMIEKRERAPRLPVQVYLEHEILELADADAYLSRDAEATRALDLLLATQGWRRFCFYRLDEFLNSHGDRAKRLFAFKDQIYLRMARGGFVMPMAAAVPERMAGARDINEDGDDKGNIQLFFADALEVKADLAKKQEVAFDNDRFDKAGRKIMAVNSPSPTYAVREYAHKRLSAPADEKRSDFTETVYWNCGIATAENGEASVTFDLSDSITTFRIMADAFTSKGLYVSTDATIESRRPFYADMKAPLEVTAGDRILLPVILVNDTDTALNAKVGVKSSALVSVMEPDQEAALP
ncbi:MAG TPA: alpha-2-macroglobulin family protein, partial [Candidatus Sumerlaeota bacterium]|nr:alpha-2-macroglobulin family protein [Candidatus Sumerlaeota bacterium]